MQRIPVESSDLVSAGYDEVARTLEIEFKEGRIYQYFEVPPDIYKGLVRAPSPGTYFFSHINAYFRYRKAGGQSRFSFTSNRAVTFVTGNQRKFRHLQQACVPRGITVKQLVVEIDEIQGHDPTRIAEHKAGEAFKRAGEVPVVICDDYWAIPALRGFPGGYMKDIHEWFEDTDFIHLMQGKTDRRIILTQTLLYKDAGQTKTFTKEIPGQIVTTPKGRGNSLERVVTLVGSGLTLAECHELQQPIIPEEASVWHAFAQWFQAG